MGEQLIGADAAVPVAWGITRPGRELASGRGYRRPVHAAADAFAGRVRTSRTRPVSRMRPDLTSAAFVRLTRLAMSERLHLRTRMDLLPCWFMECEYLVVCTAS